ncbi:MAG: hypothetical protein CMK09_06285 [Ponticaulis sp.]|nr:hypothetical protein [Ponticaulis sp.]|tara:strand:- start:1751 stop:1936 length:186 start_codon:yes stop_codon:yes gene_type:complete
MSSFAIYTIGFLILIAGLAYGAAMLGVPAEWIGVGCVILAGIGLITAVSNTRKKDETEASQ